MFYKLTNSENPQNKYVVKNLSFKEFTKIRCEICHRETIKATYDKDEFYHLLLEGGNAYPDLLEFCDAGEQLFVVSQKALTVFREQQVSGISGYERVKLFIETQKGHTEIDNEVGSYFALKVNGNIDFNYSAMLLKKKKMCNSCGQYELNRHRIWPCVIDSKSWSGADLCTLRTIPSVFVCTEKVVQLVKTHKLTGFNFEQLRDA